MVSVLVRIWRAFLPVNEVLHALGQWRVRWPFHIPQLKSRLLA